MGDFAEALRRAGLDRGEAVAAEPLWEVEALRDSESPLLDVSLEKEKPPGPSAGWPGAVSEALTAPEPDPEIPGEGAPGADEGVDEEVHREEGTRIEIPRSKDGFWKARAVLMDHSPEAERFRHFAVRVQREMDSRGAGSVLVTSALRGDGKTTTACNLALALASMAAGRRIALLDLDLRSPSVFSAMEIIPRVGIEHALSRRAPLRAACVRTDVPSLDFFPAADPVPNAHELLASPVLGSLLCELESRYDLVVCDTPPVLPVPDVPLILPHVGACVLVARAGKTHQSEFREMLDLLPRRKLIGAFLNEELSRRRASGYRYHADREKSPNARSGEVSA
ncbi:MAG: CpsD/CapB family tyrosine-protein kinase [Myxococcota bacterium]